MTLPMEIMQPCFGFHVVEKRQYRILGKNDHIVIWFFRFFKVITAGMHKSPEKEGHHDVSLKLDDVCLLVCMLCLHYTEGRCEETKHYPLSDCAKSSWVCSGSSMIWSSVDGSRSSSVLKTLVSTMKIVLTGKKWIHLRLLMEQRRYCFSALMVPFLVHETW